MKIPLKYKITFNFKISENAKKLSKDIEIGLLFMNFVFNEKTEATAVKRLSNPVPMNTGSATGWNSNAILLLHMIKKKPSNKDVLK